MLGVDFLHPTATQFPETNAGTNFPHNSIQHASPHIPLNPLFSANPPNTFFQHPHQDPCYSQVPPGVRFSFGNVVPTDHSPVTATTSAFRTLPAPSTQTSHQLGERSHFKLQTSNLTALMVTTLCCGPIGSLCSNRSSTTTNDSANQKKLPKLKNSFWLS